MKLSEKAFQVLDSLDKHEISTQRQLAGYSGISLGQVNYILKSLLEKGLVKVDNFKNNPRKIGYTYLLTAKGIEEKSSLAVRFVIGKLKEYESLRCRLTDRLIAIENEGHKNVVFVCPSVVNDFINTIIEEKQLKLIIAGHSEDWKGLKNIGPQSFDVLLIFDESPESIKEIETKLNVPRKKILSLW